MVDAISFIVGMIALAAVNASPEPDLPSEPCAFSDMSRVLALQESWHDLTMSVLSDPDFASELSYVMPDYRLAFVHADYSGILLVGGEKLSGMAQHRSHLDDYWSNTAKDVRKACASEDVKCDVSVLDDAPYGLLASTRFESDAGAIRRESLAFIDTNQCIYSIQFSSPEASVTDRGWQDVKDTLMTLRFLVGKAQRHMN